MEPRSPVWEKAKKMMYFKDPSKMDAIAQELEGLNKHGVPADSIHSMLMNWHNDPKIKDFTGEQ